MLDLLLRFLLFLIILFFALPVCVFFLVLALITDTYASLRRRWAGQAVSKPS